jgi:hypothetical protein
VRALGIESAPKVRWLPDLRALREARNAHWGYWGSWPSFASRQGWLLRAGRSHTGEDGHSPRAASLAELDREVLDAGLRSAHCVDSVCCVVPELLGAVSALRDGWLGTPRRLPALVRLAEAAAAGLYALAVLDPGLLACVSRPLLRLDGQGRLHGWDGLPAVEWSGGRGLWFWRGVEMTDSAGRSPELVTPKRIAGWANAERRRVAIERIGLEGLRGLVAELVQEDDYGRLWRTPMRIDGEPYVAVEVVNGTAEADGSRRRYFLRVPPETGSARAAVAWSFGMNAHEYNPLVET